MATLSRTKFLEYLRRSRLVGESQLEEFLPTSSEDRTAEELAAELVAAGLITEWHSGKLLNAKYRGFLLGKYKLLGHLGTGGMSSVYLAEHPVMERLVAIKVLPSRFVEDPNYLDRFKREARAAAALDHPNIVRAYDIDHDGNRHYIVMEYVDGRDLQRTVKESGIVSHEEAADYIAQAARGLQHAHEAGLVHRDVKPANCLLDNNGIVKLLDMGLAKFSEDDRPALSAIYDDSVVGTADYLAPEQAINSQGVDARADIYSLGCTLYFLLTGQPPFPEGSIAERLLKHQREEPTSIFHLRPDTPPVLVELFRRMTIKSPDDRIQFARVVEQELTAWLATKSRVPASNLVPAISPKDSGRFGSRYGQPPGAPPVVPRQPGDTVSKSGGDTMKMSSKNDNLRLAPLEEEKPKDEPIDESAQTDSEGPNVTDDVEAPKRATRPLAPLDKLLKDEPIVAESTLPRTQLTTPQPTLIESKWFPWLVFGGILAIGLLILFFMMLGSA